VASGAVCGRSFILSLGSTGRLSVLTASALILFLFFVTRFNVPGFSIHLPRIKIANGTKINAGITTDKVSVMFSEEA
jgi:hypothetical protein